MSPEHYSPGELNQPFQIIRKTETPDGSGGFVTTETTFPGPSSYHFAKVRPLRGQERQVGGGIRGLRELLFVVYRDVGVLVTDVLQYDGSRYNVRSVMPSGLSQYQEVEAESGGADAG